MLYDIGTDHAYLPIAAIKRGLVRKAYAVDNKQGPLESARNHIAHYHLEDRVIPILADGLAALENDVDVVTIAGLGGPLIARILENCPTKTVRRLIVQTAVQVQAIRVLIDAGWCIVDETVIREQDVYYTTVVFEVGAQTLNEQERAFGPMLLKKRPAVFLEQLRHEAAYLRSLTATIPDLTARARQSRRLHAIEEVLDERSNHTNIF